MPEVGAHGHAPLKLYMMKERKPGNWLSIAAMVIGFCLAGQNLFSQENGVKSDLIARAATSVQLRVESSRLSLISSTGEKLTSCRSYAAWRYGGEYKWHEDYAQKFAALRIREGQTSFDFEAGLLRIFLVAKRQRADTWNFSGEVGLQTMPEEPSFFVATLRDNILLDPGESRGLEQAILRYGDLQDGYRFWAEQCARNMTPKPRVPKAAMVGFCSWNQPGAHVTGGSQCPVLTFTM